MIIVSLQPVEKFKEGSCCACHTSQQASVPTAVSLTAAQTMHALRPQLFTEMHNFLKMFLCATCPATGF